MTAFGKLAGNINYHLPDGSREQVIRGTLYSYPEKCRITFPKNQTLVQFNVEGYIGHPLFDLPGKAVGLIAVMHETGIEDTETVTSILKITAKRAEIELERIRYEEELEKNNKTLEERENRIQTIFEGTPDAVITIDHHGVIIMEQGGRKYFWMEKNEAVGKTLTETIIPERYREQHINGLKYFLKPGEGRVLNKPIEIEAITKDKNEIPVELKISALLLSLFRSGKSATMGKAVLAIPSAK